MKLKTLIVALFLVAFSSTSFAQTFGANAYVQVNSLNITAEVANPYQQPIYCSGRVIGMTYSGHTLYAYVNTVVPAFGYRYAYVYTNAHNPFVNGWSEVVCRF